MQSQLQYCLDQLLSPANEDDPTDGDSDEEDDIVEVSSRLSDNQSRQCFKRRDPLSYDHHCRTRWMH